MPKMPNWHPFSVESVFASVQQHTTTELAVGCSSSLYMEVAIGEFKYARRNYRSSSQMTPKTHWTPNFSEAQLLPCSLVQWLSWFYLTNPKCVISTCVPTMVSYHVISYTSLTNAKGCVKYIYIVSVRGPSVPFGIHLYVLVHFHQTSGAAVRPSLSVSVSAVINTLTSCVSGQKQYQSILKLYSALCPVLDTNILTNTVATCGHTTLEEKHHLDIFWHSANLPIIQYQGSLLLWL